MSLQPGDRIDGRFEVTRLAATWVVGRDRKCKSAQCGGSHYHCAGCGAVTSMCGHPSPADCDRARLRGEHDPDWVAA